ncbi:plasmid mobilization protein [Petrocella sp. FN5]|uniref:plasmid mobilization protein n=1 Tax=Petrocella sp. FN5 TaxID=3032002 RepID=UPI0023DBAC71|nr:mobilization protein [Petrocella sp. FN5]MDF1618606.1 mobilization protein [Petrocella sp. FN5]
MKKKCDSKNRWRNKSVAFRMSPSEAEQLNKYVGLSGLTKQEYLINRSLQKDVIVNGNPRVYKALRDLFRENLEELQRLEKVSDDNLDLIALIPYMATIMDGLKGDLNE